MKLTKIEDAILIEGDEVDAQEVIDLLGIIFGIREAKTAQDLINWNANVQHIFQEMLEESFNRLINTSRSGWNSRLHEALVILQGGQ